MTRLSLDRRIRLSEQVYTTLRGMIVRGELRPEAQISEPELCERLQVSRTPMREALLKLADEGLVVIYPQFGSFVAPILLEAVEQAQFIREHLECAILREVVTRIDLRGLAHLSELLTLQAGAAPDRFYELDEELHASFAEIAGRAGAWRLIQQSKAHLDRVRHLSLPVPDQIPKLIQQHRAIVEAIAARDAATAVSALQTHLREVFATVKRLGLGEADPTKLPKRQRKG
jgi:DNA-binding GntR family transcriptional regulator